MSGGHLLGEPRQLSYPGGKNGMWVVDCACGYQSQPATTPRRAELPALDHRDAKEREQHR